MIWNSWSDFFAMGGYAFYVWGSYVVTLLLVAAEIALVRNRKLRTLAHLRRLSLASRRGERVGSANDVRNDADEAVGSN